jgi:mannose-1-phosphate guanylyltransferase / mannose-6-phosphate isomerase
MAAQVKRNFSMKAHDMNTLRPVILCGGSGTRLWPLSRSGFPKQFLCLTGQDSLFQLTAKRLNGLCPQGVQTQPPLIVSSEEYRFLVAEQLREAGLGASSLVLEPVGKNTAPALTLAALAATEDAEDPILFVSPSDQVISDDAAFRASAHRAIESAARGSVVILGVKPDRPATGYGYIESHPSQVDQGVQKVMCFVEKPDEVTAMQYLASGQHSWNAGIFVVRASHWLELLGRFRPDILQAVRLAWATRSMDQVFIRPDRDRFASVPAESVDRAVLEQCSGGTFPLQMVGLDAGWSDVGSWDSVWEVLPKDPADNAHMGDVLSIACSGTLVHASHRLVTLVGVKNLIVVETPDAVLVADRSSSQDIKKIVAALEQAQRQEHLLHRKVHRPWGWYDSVDEAGRFKVKRIMVKPKASLSLQLHHHRAEHWIVVQGTAEVTNGDQVHTLTENQSTYIPLGQVHRLRNPGLIPLEIIEVQSGAYLGEDDIERFADAYGRAS